MSDPAASYYPETATHSWALWVGSFLTLLVLFVALFGPLLARQDPLQENYVAQVEGKYKRPPFPPGTEGYPLGADEFGRDVLSRLLWAVRPTLTLALVVAALRLSIGIFTGLVAGWSSRWPGRVTDALISGALSVPVLFIALCVIAALANRWGVWAFILGLSLTGWGEPARLVQEQTRAIKSQLFVEAARAMGGSGGQTVLSHVIPNVLPRMWVQMPFEISAALLTTAALGFLGYFVNAVWIPVEDFTGLRAAGAPELSQMMGASITSQPWTAVFAGTLVFLIILAFNLLGEGLRSRLGSERRRSVEPDRGFARAGSWLEERVYLAVSEWRRTAATGGAFAALVLIVGGGSWLLWRAQNSGLEITQIQIPGGNLWAAEMHDAQGTQWNAARGPAQAQLLWSYTAPGPFMSGPVIDRNGNLYITGAGNRVYSFTASGEARGFVQLAHVPFGSPALAADGNIIIADQDGGLTAFDGQGRLLWEYRSSPPITTRSSPVIGPDDTVYLTLHDHIVAVDASGQLRWQVELPTYSFVSPMPRLSPKGEYLLFEDAIVDARTGETQFGKTSDPMDKYLVGSDGEMYYQTTDRFMEWKPTETGAVMTQRIKLDERSLGTSFQFPTLTGISPSHQAWLYYSGSWEYTRMVWVGAQGQGMQIIDFPYRPGRLIGMDAGGVAYVCGLMNSRSKPECRAVRLDSGAVVWKIDLDSKNEPVGGALVEGRLYITTAEGGLFAFGR